MTREVSGRTLRDFSRKTDFYSILVFYFHTFLAHSNEEIRRGNPSKRSWEEIFAEKISYPPLEDHQLYDGIKTGVA